jgi:hypothetical protein
MHLNFHTTTADIDAILPIIAKIGRRMHDDLTLSGIVAG